MSEAKNQNIIGIAREIIDEETDSSTAFHVIRHISLDFGGGYSIVSLDSYVRQSSFERGRRPVGSVQVSVFGSPARAEDVLDWAYRAVAAPVEDGATDAYGQPLTAHSLTRGKPVYAAPSEAA